MRVRTYDALRNFVSIAQFTSLSSAAERLNITKGALSHQVKRLEDELGFSVFERYPRGIRLSKKGAVLLEAATQAFGQIEASVDLLTETSDQTLTIGVTTYFASRWLSPRLMDFMHHYPDIRLRIDPMIDLLNFAGEEVDIAIRWGNGKWKDCEIEELFNCPAWPTGNRDAYERIQEEGIDNAFDHFTLLRDREDSNAWSEWYEAAGLQDRKRLDTLIIPDPNVRVQAVLDGQGVALNDDLINAEIENGQLFRLSAIELSDYGYFLAYQKPARQNLGVEAFVSWIMDVR